MTIVEFFLILRVPLLLLYSIFSSLPTCLPFFIADVRTYPLCVKVLIEGLPSNADESFFFSLSLARSFFRFYIVYVVNKYGTTLSAFCRENICEEEKERRQQNNAI